SVMGGYTKYHPNAAEKYRIEELGGDYAAMAIAFGGYGEEVTDPAEIVPAIERALAQNAKGVPALLQIITREELNMARDLPSGVGPQDQA
ncbi:MAG: hypothetical protein GY802_04870, partial [Gammaproteobacteria bacterium]|nr:hypothetical protein [Gammaproteobacteria bacterium]